MNPPPANFDSLARVYRSLEFLAFGRDLERARFCLIDQLAGCREILVLGEGDGRCLAQLVRAAPAARIHCLDASAAMLACAEARLAGSEAHDRVTFERADILAVTLPPARYDAVITCFFLDCFTADQVAILATRVNQSLRGKAQWLFADFALPPRGIARLRARVWLAMLYTFFRWQIRLRTSVLPPSEDLIQQAGFAAKASRTFQGGLLRSVLFERCPPAPSGTVATTNARPV